MNDEPRSDGSRVVVMGGGVAGLEALLALHDLAGAWAELTLVAPQPDFLYKPLLVEEPFDLAPAERHELAPLAEEKGARFVRHSVSAVDTDTHVVKLTRSLDPWPHSEVGRFHRGIAVAIICFGILVIGAGAGLNHAPGDLAVLGCALLVSTVVALYLVAEPVLRWGPPAPPSARPSSRP